jgi:hypothetical protein
MMSQTGEVDLLVLWADGLPAVMCFGVTYDEELYTCNHACALRELDSGTILDNDGEQVEILDAIGEGAIYQLLPDVQLGRELAHG